MHIGILGSGNIGHNTAVHFLKAGHHVTLANSRGPDSLRDLVGKLGARARAATAAEAVRGAELVLLAVPWTAREATVAAAGGPAAFAGKVVVDALNPYLEYSAVEDLGGKTSSAVVAALLDPGARVVKPFNTINFQVLADQARPDAPPAGRIAIPLCGDDVEAKRTVAALIEAIGFAPVDAGGLGRGRWQEPHRPLYDRDFSPAELAQELDRLDRGANDALCLDLLNTMVAGTDLLPDPGTIAGAGVRWAFAATAPRSPPIVADTSRCKTAGSLHKTTQK